MGRASKHADAVWDRAFEREKAGDGRAADFLTLRRMRRAAAPGRAERRGPRPEMAFRYYPEDPKGTLGSILAAMAWARDERRHGDYRELERLLREVEKSYRCKER